MLNAGSSAKRDSDDEGRSSQSDVEFAGASLSPALVATTPAVRKGAGSKATGGKDANEESSSAARARKRKSAGASSMPEESLVRRALRFKNVVVANITRKKLPFLGRAMDGFQQAPHHVRALIFFAFVAWKILMTLVVLPLLFKYVFSKGYGMLRPKGVSDIREDTSSDIASARVLYVVGAPTRFLEVKKDGKMTQLDRLSKLLAPILQDGVESMVSPPYHYEVDAFLLLGYKLESEDREKIAKYLPSGVGLQVWDDALPFDYMGGNPKKIQLALQRQQRFIIRDKINEYDFFIVVEDGMRITGTHVAHFMQMSKELDKLQPMLASDSSINDDTKKQFSAFMPGFIEVEVVSGEEVMTVDGDSSTPFVNRRVNPKVCCSIPHADDVGIPSALTSGSLVLWEATNSSAVRKISESSLLDRVYIQSGPFPLSDQFRADVSDSGAAQSWSWMATREQLLALHKKKCDIFPRYSVPEEGKGRKQTGCSFERAVSLHPDHISNHLVYHASNDIHNDPLIIPRLEKVDDFYSKLSSFVEENSREILAEQR